MHERSISGQAIRDLDLNIDDVLSDWPSVGVAGDAVFGNRDNPILAAGWFVIFFGHELMQATGEQCPGRVDGCPSSQYGFEKFWFPHAREGNYVPLTAKHPWYNGVKQEVGEVRLNPKHGQNRDNEVFSMGMITQIIGPILMIYELKAAGVSINIPPEIEEDMLELCKKIQVYSDCFCGRLSILDKLDEERN